VRRRLCIVDLLIFIDHGVARDDIKDLAARGGRVGVGVGD
jgi:hypothetical protein